jgi:hypothetical protein
MVLAERFIGRRFCDQAPGEQCEPVDLQFARADRFAAAFEDQHLIGRQAERVAGLHQGPALIAPSVRTALLIAKAATVMARGLRDHLDDIAAELADHFSGSYA